MEIKLPLLGLLLTVSAGRFKFADYVSPYHHLSAMQDQYRRVTAQRCPMDLPLPLRALDGEICEGIAPECIEAAISHKMRHDAANSALLVIFGDG